MATLTQSMTRRANILVIVTALLGPSWAWLMHAVGDAPAPTEPVIGTPTPESEPVLDASDRLAKVSNELERNLTLARLVDGAMAADAHGSVRDDDRVDIPTTGLPHKGAAPESARVAMLECSDFTCPYCERASHTVDELIARNDDLAFYYLHAPLRTVGAGARAAVAAAAAQRQDAFWPMHEALFHTRIDSDRTAIDLARSLDLDAERFATDLVDPVLHAEVARQRTLCTDAGVRGVPTFFINGRRFVGAQPIEAFQRVIDEERR